MRFARLLSTGGLAVAAIAALASAASAQQIYRIVGADGRVTFSDKPPAEPNVRAGTAAVVPLPAGSATNSALPFELRQVASRYPVTLYTSPNCGPCETGRSFLSGRGVPFSEKTVSTNDDITALQRLSGAATLPFMTIGGQQLKGYSEAEWSQFLDAAGYPKASQLPASYRPPAPTPLVVAQEPPAAQRPAAAAPAPAAPTPAEPPPNPAGIRF